MIREYFNEIFSSLVYKSLIKQTTGIENIPKQGGYIVAANHTSYLDIPVEYAVFLKRGVAYIRFIAKKELLQDNFFRIFTLLFQFKKNKVIPIDRENPESALKEAEIALGNGEVVGMFPEGTRSQTGKLQKGKTGVARLALATKSPIVPVGITGTFDLMPAGKKFPKLKKKVRVNIGKPLHFDKYYGKHSKKIFAEVTSVVMCKIAGLLNRGEQR